MASSSGGYRFWSERELVAVRDSLLVAGPILTPNLDELALLAWDDAQALAADPSRRVAAAERLLRAGVSAVVATGGHGPEDEPSRDLVLRPGEEPVWIERVREPGPGIRGSGCRFATSLARSPAARTSSKPPPPQVTTSPGGSGKGKGPPGAAPETPELGRGCEANLHRALALRGSGAVLPRVAAVAQW